MARLLPTLALLAVAASPAQAAEGHGSGGSVVDLLIQAANLALLLGVLVYFGRKPIVGFFRDRRTRIKGELDEAAGLLDAAEERYAEWQRKLIDLEREMEGIREDGRRRAEEEGREIVDDARATADRIRRDATAAIEQELRRAQAELRAEAAELAARMARGILEEQLGDPDRERLMDEFIEGVESRGGP